MASHTHGQVCQFDTPHLPPHPCLACGVGHDPVTIACPDPDTCRAIAQSLASPSARRARDRTRYRMFDAFFDAHADRD